MVRLRGGDGNLFPEHILMSSKHVFYAQAIGDRFKFMQIQHKKTMAAWQVSEKMVRCRGSLVEVRGRIVVLEMALKLFGLHRYKTQE